MCIGLSLPLPLSLSSKATYFKNPSLFWSSYLFCFPLWISNDGRIEHISLVAAGTGMGAAAVFERGDSVDEIQNARTVSSKDLLSKDAL